MTNLHRPVRRRTCDAYPVLRPKPERIVITLFVCAVARERAPAYAHPSLRSGLFRCAAQRHLRATALRPGDTLIFRCERRRQEWHLPIAAAFRAAVHRQVARDAAKKKGGRHV